MSLRLAKDNQYKVIMSLRRLISILKNCEKIDLAVLYTALLQIL